MGRTVRGNSTPSLKPVQKIELSEKNIKLRGILVACLLVLGVVLIAQGVKGFFTTEAGWQAIEAKGKGASCSNEFVFLYNLGSNGVSATAENKAIVTLYTEATKNAYQLFHSRQSFEQVNNVYTINQHPNEVIVVDEALYKALSLVQENASRYLYLAPIYNRYDDIFYCDDDSQLVDFDPRLSEAVAEEYRAVAAYARDAAQIDLQLLGENQVRLYVSEEYLQYAKENGITDFIDFFWLKNAFIVDYLAEIMIAKGYTAGSISSYDGFSRNLDKRTDTVYAFNIYDKVGQTAYTAAIMQYTGSKSIVYLRNYLMSSMDERQYYELTNGEIRTPYIDMEDGVSKTAKNNLVAYSKTKSCAEIAMQVAPIYIADAFEEEKLLGLQDADIYSVYCKESAICYNEKTLTLSDIYAGEAVTYTTDYVGDK